MTISEPVSARRASRNGPAFFRQGFRPFFFGAGAVGAIAIPVWLLVLFGVVDVPTLFDLTAWHAHEMIFGYAGAVIAGFLLTAIPNWTGRLPLQGLPLAALFGAWLFGRAAMAGSAYLGIIPAAVIDLSFLVLMLAVVLREIVSGRNWRNLPMPAALAVLIAANVLMHLEAADGPLWAATGERLGIAVVILLISLIGGRIIPSFTRNWLVKRGALSLPAAFSRYDRFCIAVTLIGLGAWVIAPENEFAGAALMMAGALTLFRLARWRGLSTLAEPLVWSLHLGFLWVPTGLAMLGLGVFLPEIFPPSAGQHALTVGAIGSMTLAVMTRATLGHSGRQLLADHWTSAIYIAIALAALFRVAAPIFLPAYDSLLWGSGIAWTAAFLLFSVHYGRMMLADTRRPASDPVGGNLKAR
jgi:uncharacterized protein involved in response to NO